MADIKRISVQEAHAKTNAKQALLVCAYEDEAKCRMFNLEGSISFSKFQPRAASLPKTQEIIFYGAGPGEASAVGQAAKYQEQGFTNVNVLKGGVEAWKAAGYAMNGWLRRDLHDSSASAKWSGEPDDEFGSRGAQADYLSKLRRLLAKMEPDDQKPLLNMVQKVARD